MARCMVYEPSLAIDLRARWMTSGFLVMECTQTTGATVLHAMAPAVDRIKARRVSTATSTATAARSPRDELVVWPSRVSLASSWTGGGQPVWTVPPLPLEPTSVELLVVDDEDAFVQLDVQRTGER
jgi:hypothetical protein